MSVQETEQRIDDTLAGAPVEYRTPAARPTLAEAQAWCKNLAETHYENFHVATRFLPKRLRPHFQTIYAYCRVADDLGDEVGDPALSLELLASWRAMLDECYDAPERSRHPVFVALAETVQECAIPREPFADLLKAFALDQTKTRYESLAELEEYARYSANPVGRLVLYMAGLRSSSSTFAPPAVSALAAASPAAPPPTTITSAFMRTPGSRSSAPAPSPGCGASPPSAHWPAC